MKISNWTTRNLTILIAAIAITGLSFGAPVCGTAIGDDQDTKQESSDDGFDTDAPEFDASDDPRGLTKKPVAAEDIGVDSKLGDMIPMSLRFKDQNNRQVQLGDYFDGEHPVLLSFNYSDCPKLCSVQLQNMTLALREISQVAGKDFQIVSISMDPKEQTSRALETKKKFTKMYNKKGTDDGWHFLTGKAANISKAADVCGFRYKYIRKQKLFSHPPVFILIAPDGKIARYVHGLSYDPDVMEKAIDETADGIIGKPVNILSYGLGCFLFDESTGKYTFQAMTAMRLGGALTALLLVITLVPYWFFRRGQTDDGKKESGLPLASAN
ncbi:MAG: SCO family protein [Mariniblastus sp.]